MHSLIVYKAVDYSILYTKRKTQKEKNVYKTSGDVTEQPRPIKGR
jgi:hypothetical protein